MIPPGFIQDLLARVDIVELVGRHVTLRKTGANHMGLCPFHAEKSPSFSVNAGKQFYHCFGCGASGDAIKFLTEHTGASFREAVADLAGQVGLAVPDEEESPQARAEASLRREKAQTLADVLAKATVSYREQLRQSPRAIDYLKGRGLTGTIAARFGLGYAPAGWRHLSSVFPRYDDPLLAEAGLVITQGDDAADEADRKRYDRFRDRVMFPIRDLAGDVIAFGGRVLDAGEPKYLNSPETPLFTKGRELYGLFEARRAIRERGHVLVVEGYMDVVALAQHGLEQAVATLGTACTDDHVRKLLRFTSTVVFAFDGDAAGRRAAARALVAALPHASDTRSFKFLFLPSEHDPDSYVREHGMVDFEARIAGSVPLSRQLLEVAGDGCDLGTAEGRAKMLAQARPMWGALPEGALRTQLLRDLAAAAQVEADEVARLWRVGPAGTARTRPSPPAEGSPRRVAMARAAQSGPASSAARLLMLQSAWWDVLSEAERDALHGVEGWHGDFFRWLERTLHEHGPQPWAALRAGFAAEPWSAHAAALLEGIHADLEPIEGDLHRAVAQLIRGSPFKPAGIPTGPAARPD